MVNSKENIKRLLLLTYLFFGIIGFIFGMRTSIFYYVQRTYLDSYGPIANMILISGICMQISLYLTGIFIQKLGYKKMLNFGLIAFVIPIFLMYFVNGYMIFAFMYTLLMFSYGIAVIILNLYVSVLVPERKSNNLMMLHLFFCIGALIGPKCISFANENAISWQLLMTLTGIPLAVIFIITSMSKGISENQNVSKKKKVESPVKTARNVSILFIVVFMCSQVWEYGIGTWFIIFATNGKGKRPEEAATLLTIFYAMYPIVRLVLYKVIHKFNLNYILMGAFLYSAVMALLGSITNVTIFYSLTGAGVAIIYPAFMAYMQEQFESEVEKKIGFISMIGGLLQYVAIWSVGIVSDQFGITIGFNYMIIYLFIGFFGLVGLKSKKDVLIYRIQ